eukprot:gene9721-10416_t
MTVVVVAVVLALLLELTEFVLYKGERLLIWNQFFGIVTAILTLAEPEPEPEPG